MERTGMRKYTMIEKKNTSKRSLIEDNSPDSFLYSKIINDLKKHSNDDKRMNDIDLLNCIKDFRELTRKSKYQMKVLEQRLLRRIIFPIMNETSNIDITRQCSKIISNILKNKNNFYKIFPEIIIIVKELLNILIVNFNSTLTPDILKVFQIMTDNKEILQKLSKEEDISGRDFQEKINNINLLKNLSNNRLNTNDNTNSNDVRTKSINLMVLTRIFVEKFLDDLSSSNKNILLKIIHKIYELDSIYLNEESIEPVIRCFGDKDQNVVISSLNIILIYARDKSFHQTLVNNNIIYRLVIVYKLGMIETDVILVKILLIFYDTKNMHEILFESKIVLILQNYLINYKELENEEFFRNLFEIFKKIITIQPLNNPVKEDKNLQAKIFEKAVSLSQNTKKEKILLSCLSTIELMITEYPSFLLHTDDQLMSVIENMPQLLKSKNIEILKYSLGIFEKILKKDSNFFFDKYAKNNERNFNVRNIIHSTIGLINEFYLNDEIINISCKILIELSQSGNSHNYFLKEPQITILRVFNENLIQERLKYNKENEKLSNDQEKRVVKDFTMISPLKDASSSKENSPIQGNKKSILKLNKEIKPSKFKEIKKRKNEQEELKDFIEKRKREISIILKESVQIIANLTKYEENLEILTNKGFLDIINKMLNSQNLEELSKITQCIEGFCKSRTSIEIILHENMLCKILNIYRLYAYKIKISEKSLIAARKKNIDKKLTISSNNITTLNKINKSQSYYENLHEDQDLMEKIACKKNILNSLKKILECDIKLQKQFINDQGLIILLEDVMFLGRLSESTDEVNSNVLKVLYVITYNINKLFINYFSNKSETEMEEYLELENGMIQSANSSKFQLDDSDENSQERDESFELKNLKRPQEVGNLTAEDDQVLDNIHNFKRQLSKDLFMSKLIGIGKNETTTAVTYKELVKILINLYLNRYYLQYFTTDSVFDDVMNVIERILFKLKIKTDYDIVKLLLIFLKFICEEEKLIKRFLESSIISKLLGIINSHEFYTLIDKEELSQFYYNTSLVLLRLSEFKGYTDRFNFNDNFLGVLENLYDHNSMNGKIYVVNIIKNILSEKSNFFEEDKMLSFINKIVSQNNTIVIYEFLELIRVLVHNRNLCKKMENVFKYLIIEIKSNSYSPKFKKRILEIILCLSYENSNIKDFALQDLLILIKNLDIKINKKTKLLILMNFSSISSNFSYLKTISEKKTTKNPELDDSTKSMLGQMEGLSISKNEFVEIINQLLDSDRFSQILVQRLLLNITCIDDIDLSIISEKIFEMLIQIISTCRAMQDSIIVFALSVLINLSNRNILKKEINYLKGQTIFYDSVEDYVTVREEDAENSINLSVIENYKQKASLNNTTNQFDSVSEGNLNNVRVADYILERLPNIVMVIEDLFLMNNLDISALTIMFACNMSQKIVKSGRENLVEKITNCIKDFFFKYTTNFSNADSGKIYIISVLRFCVSLSEDEKNVVGHKKLFETVNLHLKGDQSQNTIIIKLKNDDLIKNTINYMLVESYIKFLNVVFRVETGLNIFTNLNLIREIVDYYKLLVKDFSEFFVVDSLNIIEMNLSLQEFIITILHMFVNFLQVKNLEYFDPATIQKEISKIILNLISYQPDVFISDLKSLIVYIIFIITDKNFHNDEEVTTSTTSTWNRSILNKSTINWLIKSFKVPTNSYQIDYYSLRLFIINVNPDSQEEMFWTSSKFLHKLGKYLRLSGNEDERLCILHKESVKLLNVISFDVRSHQKLFNTGIYNHFKSSLYLKQSNDKSLSIGKEEVIILVNMLCNKENEGFVRDDISSLLKLIFLCKDLEYNIFAALFDVYISYTIKNSNSGNNRKKKIFKEDYLILFNLLYENLRQNFSQMIFLIVNYAKEYESFAQQLVSDESIVLTIYSDFKNFDKKFPSLFEEFEAFLTILIFYVNFNLTTKIEEIISELMNKIIDNKLAMSNINIIKSTIGFIFYFYFKSTELNINLLQSEAILKEYLRKFNFSEFINLLCKNSIKRKEISHIYLLCSILFKDLYKNILNYLKSENNFLFRRDFIISFFDSMIDLKTLDIREFVYVINIVNNLMFYDQSLPGLEDFFIQAIHVYENFFMKSLEKNENLNNLNNFINSLYFFFDLIKDARDISTELFNKIIKFIINVLQVFSPNSEQKEILIRYYHEILSLFKIKCVDDLKLITTFFLKIHYDKDFKYIEILIMETIIENTDRDILVKQFEIILQLVKMIFPSEFDKNKIQNFLIISKNIFYKLNESNSNIVKSANNKFKTIFLESYAKIENEIKVDDELHEKFIKFLEKIKL